jgi:hypothetical protein
LDSVTTEQYLVRITETTKCQQGTMLNHVAGETAARYVNKQTSRENFSVELYPVASKQLESAKLKKSLIIFSLICCRATYPLLLYMMTEWLLVELTEYFN